MEATFSGGFYVKEKFCWSIETLEEFESERKWKFYSCVVTSRIGTSSDLFNLNAQISTLTRLLSAAPRQQRRNIIIFTLDGDVYN